MSRGSANSYESGASCTLYQVEGVRVREQGGTCSAEESHEMHMVVCTQPPCITMHPQAGHATQPRKLLTAAPARTCSSAAAGPAPAAAAGPSAAPSPLSPAAAAAACLAACLAASLRVRRSGWGPMGWTRCQRCGQGANGVRTTKLTPHQRALLAASLSRAATAQQEPSHWLPNTRCR